MKKTIALTSLLLYGSIFNACSNRTIQADNNNTKTETIKETSFAGKLLIATLTFLGTKGDIEKTLRATKFGGNASGYYVGEKLSIMQKRYKDKEEQLIENILQIDKEIEELEKKNVQFSDELTSMQKEIQELLQKKESQRDQERKLTELSIKNELKEKQYKLEFLLKENEKIAQKITFSKQKVNEYTYTQEDKKEILKSVNFLENSSNNYKTELNNKLTSINKMINTL